MARHVFSSDWPCVISGRARFLPGSASRHLPEWRRPPSGSGPAGGRKRAALPYGESGFHARPASRAPNGALHPRPAASWGCPPPSSRPADRHARGALRGEFRHQCPLRYRHRPNVEPGVHQEARGPFQAPIRQLDSPIEARKAAINSPARRRARLEGSVVRRGCKGRRGSSRTPARASHRTVSGRARRAADQVRRFHASDPTFYPKCTFCKRVHSELVRFRLQLQEADPC